MKVITYVYICKIKILGFPFAVLDENLAKDWVSGDPDSRYYETLRVQDKL